MGIDYAASVFDQMLTRFIVEQKISDGTQQRTLILDFDGAFAGDQFPGKRGKTTPGAVGASELSMAALVQEAGGRYSELAWNGVIYTHTAQGCGGNPNVVYAYDLATNKVGSWGPAGGGMWGRSGPAISTRDSSTSTSSGTGGRIIGISSRSLTPV